MPEQMDEEVHERCQRVLDRVVDVNTAVASAVHRSAGLPTVSNPITDLWSVQRKLATTYAETRRALDRVEIVIDELDPDYKPTPRRIKSEHGDRLAERYDGPVQVLSLMILEQNRREWLHAKEDAIGAEHVERHGLTENQRRALGELQDAWQAYDGGEEWSDSAGGEGGDGR